MNKTTARKKKNRFFGKLLIVVLTLSLVLGAAFIVSKPQLRFLAADYFGKIGGNVSLKASDSDSYDLKDYSVSELKNSENVTFDQSLMLVNTDSMLSDSFDAEVSEYKDSGVYMNDCIMSSYEELKSKVLDECSQELLVTSAYRDAKEQERVKAEEGDTAQAVGASEHQTGLALDLCIQNFGGEAFLKSDAGQLVNSKCCDYGFIIRYPYYGKTETGIDYEPWHVRYVGIPHAQIIMRNSLTLEEYIVELGLDKFYEYDGYLISRQSTDTLKLPEHFRNAVISPDNLGNFVVTVLL